jgi:SAM-dependent methyltransferase
VLLRSIHRAAIQVPRTRALAPALAEVAGPAESLLDVGAGDGALGEAVARAIGASRVAGADILAQPGARLPVAIYEGDTLPFDAGAFEVVLLSDVLHHAASPTRLLDEAARVARRAVVVKEHFAFDAASRRLLLALDIAANRQYGIAVRGSYLSPADLVTLASGAELRVGALRWPLDVHAWPVRWLVPSALHFAARLEKAAR